MLYLKSHHTTSVLRSVMFLLMHYKDVLAFILPHYFLVAFDLYKEPEVEVLLIRDTLYNAIEFVIKTFFMKVSLLECDVCVYEF